MFEYAISAGEGTLIECGIADDTGIQVLTDLSLDEGHTLIFGPAADDCTTGQ